MLNVNCFAGEKKVVDVKLVRYEQEECTEKIAYNTLLCCNINKTKTQDVIS